MKVHVKLLSIGLLALLVLSVCLFSVHTVVAQQSSAVSKLQAAGDAVSQAFNAVSDAEKAGVNVTGLVNRLNGAADLLAQAEIAYNNGDLAGTSAKADSVLPIAQEVGSSAQAAESTASANAQFGFWLAFGIFVGGSIVFVSVLFVVWRRFKKNYYKNLVDTKPEVIDGEA